MCNEKAASFETAFGTPGETRTHYLALRRRTLYPGELRGQIVTIALYRKKESVSTKFAAIFGGCGIYYWECSYFGGDTMGAEGVLYADVDDMIFAEEVSLPSDR